MGQLTSSDGFLEILDRTLLSLEAIALLMMKPAKLLQNLGMAWVTFKNSAVGGLGTIILGNT